jgi:hypothetical protein
MYGLLRGSALAIHCDAGHVIGKPSDQAAGPCDISRLRPNSVYAPEYNIIHRAWINPSSLDERAQDVSTEIRRVNSRQTPLLLSNRRTDGIDNVGFGSHVGNSSNV